MLYLQGWLLGYQLAFDSGKSKLTKNNFALGYSTGDFVIHTNVNDGQVNKLLAEPQWGNIRSFVSEIQ